VLLADAFGIGDASMHSSLNAFLQADPDVPMENYKFHSSKVIELLESLQKDVREEKEKLDSDEVDTVQTYDKYMLDKQFEVKTKKMLTARANKKRSDTIEEIAMSSAQLSTVAATLLEDKKYLMELSNICQDKAKTWDQRSRVRADELSALTSAIGLIEGEVSEKTSAATVRLAQRGTSVRLALALEPSTLNQIEYEAEALDVKTPMAFLQRAVHKHKSQKEPTEGVAQAVATLLKSQGSKLHSALLTSIASQIASDPFSSGPFKKIQTLIEELINRLKQEAANEADQKSFCDKSIGEAEEKRDSAAEKVKELNIGMASLEANRDKLKEELEGLKSEISDLDEKRSAADKMREEEKSENEATVKTAKEGLEALKTAIGILEDFYKSAKGESVDFMQSRGPEVDAPESGFDNKEAYKGNAKSGGVLAMLDVIKSDFERTISETDKAEVEAKQDHTAYKDESGVALQAAKDAKKQKTSQFDDVEEKLESSDQDLTAQAKILGNSIEELLELKPACVDTGMSYDERVERRQDEISALKKGLCVLTKFKEYGVDNVAENC